MGMERERDKLRNEEKMILYWQFLGQKVIDFKTVMENRGKRLYVMRTFDSLLWHCYYFGWAIVSVQMSHLCHDLP